MTEDEIVGWYHGLDGHEFEQAPRAGDGQRSLKCCSPWGHKELDMTEGLAELRVILNKQTSVIFSTFSVSSLKLNLKCSYSK